MKNQFIIPQKGQIEYILGIDFGHGETSAAICHIDDNIDPSDIDITNSGNTTLPSVLYVSSSNGDVYIGQRAIDKYREERKGDFYAYFKESPYTLDEQELPNLKIMKMFMREVYHMICHSRSELMEGEKIKNNHVVFIACPSKSQHWGEEEMQNYVQLAVDAGLPIAGVVIEDKFHLSGIVRESRAAYIRTLQSPETAVEMKKGILVIDFGSSTIDITYYKDGEKPVDKGYQIGASLIEKSIKEYLGTKHEEWDEEQHPDVVEAIKNYTSEDTYFLYKIRESKETFFKNHARVIEIPNRLPSFVLGQTKNVNFYIEDAWLKTKIIKDYITKIEKAFVDFRDTFIKEDSISLLCMTGGAARMDFARDIARSVFGETKTLQPKDYSLTVSNGIATAGRADILLYYMLQELLRIEHSTIYWDVKTNARDNICNLIINNVEDVFRDFYQSSSWYAIYGSHTINNLEKAINSRLNYISGKYVEELDKAFRSELEKHINYTYLPQIKKYILDHFPHYEIERIESCCLSKDVALKIQPDNFDSLNNAIRDAVVKIMDGFFALIGKVLLNIVVDVVDGTATLLENFGKKIANEWNGYEKYKYASLSKRLKRDRLEYNGRDTILDSKQQKEVYDSFIGKKDEYTRTLKGDIYDILPAFKDQCDKAQKQAIKEYIISVTNAIQLQIK